VFTAALDTSALWPSRQRDFLLSLAVEGLYRPVWSERILEELAYAEPDKLVELGVDPVEARARATHLLREMRTHFQDAEVTGWEPLEGTFGLPDPNDEHVVAAAVVGGAGAIVTHNLRDFPTDRLPRGLEVITPQDFAANTVEIDPMRARAAVEGMANRTGRAGLRLTVAEILDLLAERYGMTAAVDLLR
jgi:predicted nucleic acid-binding protein